MLSMAMKIAGFLALMLVIGGHGQSQVLDPHNPSTNLLTAISFFNGYFSNVETVQNEERYHSSDHQDSINVTFIPVEVPAFLPFPAVYFLENVNNVIYRQQILVFRELEDGTIIIHPHNITDPNENEVIDLSTLMDLDVEDFEEPPEECHPTFNLVEDNVIVGSWPDCKNRLENGQPPLLGVTVTCHSYSVVNTDPLSREGASRSVYNHVRIGSRFPYPPYLQERLANFNLPCDD